MSDDNKLSCSHYIEFQFLTLPLSSNVCMRWHRYEPRPHPTVSLLQLLNEYSLCERQFCQNVDFPLKSSLAVPTNIIIHVINLKKRETKTVKKKKYSVSLSILATYSKRSSNLIFFM